MTESELDATGLEIIAECRNELYMNMPFLGEALFALEALPGGGVTAAVATDGMKLYCSGAYLADIYLRSAAGADRVYLHAVLHCMLRHLSKKKGKAAELWDLACDAAVESILDDLSYACLRSAVSPAKLKFYGECRSEMRVLTAEGIYRKLLRDAPSEYEAARLQRLFFSDDHGLWDPEKNDDAPSPQEQDDRWKQIASRTGTGMETVLSKEANGGEAIAEQVRISSRDDTDYRAFLRRFAAPREIMKADEDSFDYIYYSLGLRRYGNMPLVEPQETKEEKRIEDFVIAVDTSMSTSGALVREFLRCTYSILRSTETFTRRLNIHIIQCDNEVRSDARITSFKELEHYMEGVNLCGGSATDFRPVFEHVDGLVKKGEFSSLRGIVYFTDGMGIYPKKRPEYEAAFVLLEEPPLSFPMPPWCTRLVLSLPEGYDGEQRSGEWEEETEMPEL